MLRSRRKRRRGTVSLEKLKRWGVSISTLRRSSLELAELVNSLKNTTAERLIDAWKEVFPHFITKDNTWQADYGNKHILVRMIPMLALLNRSEMCAIEDALQQAIIKGTLSAKRYAESDGEVEVELSVQYGSPDDQEAIGDNDGDGEEEVLA